MKRKIIPLVFFLLICSSSIKSYAQQANFQVSPPPVPWYEFNQGQMDIKAGATLLYMDGEVDDPDYGGDVAVYGAGVNVFYRYAFRSKFAIDVGGLIVGADGKVGDPTTMQMMLSSIPVDLEFQPVKNDKVSLILFAGFNFSWCYIYIDSDTGTDWAKVDIWTSMYGPQGGIQAALKVGDFVFTPFFMVARLSGDASLSADSSDGSFSGSAGVPTTTSYFYGIDIIYKPWNITLSSIIQQALSSGSNNGYKTYVLTISYHFQIDQGVNSEDETAGSGDADTKQLKKQPVSRKKIK